MEYSFQRYLVAKKSVDDRALNQHVWEALKDALAQMEKQPLKVLEAGAGTGTMVERALERGLIKDAVYRALDSEPENIQAARSRILGWAGRSGWQARVVDAGIDLSRGDSKVSVHLETRDILDLMRHRKRPVCDLLIANAFLDLFDISRILPGLRRLVKPGGLAYFSINFDGLTAFEPVFDNQLEERILAAYHSSMDERITNGSPSGDSRAGRHLFTELPRAGFQVLDAGSSDWVVYPRKGVYPDDEAFFLHHILHFFEVSLRGRPEITAEELKSWLDRRHAEVETAGLVFMAHQIDVLAGVVETG